MIRLCLLSLLLMMHGAIAYAQTMVISPPDGIGTRDQMEFSVLEVALKALGEDSEALALSPAFSLAPSLIPQVADKNAPICLGTYNASLEKGAISPAVLQLLTGAHRERTLKPLKDCNQATDVSQAYLLVGQSRTCQESDRTKSPGEYWAVIIDNGKQEGLAACLVVNPQTGRIEVKGVAAVVTASFIMKRF